MTKRKIIFLLVTMQTFLFRAEGYSQLPLITDNAYTSGKKNGQLELSNGLGFNNEHRCVEKSTEIAPVFTYGIHDNVDLIAGIPFLFSEINEDSSLTRAAGFSDMILEIKYCILEKGLFSIALKPGISIPTGKYEEGLGSGKMSGSFFTISSMDLTPYFINVNVGYMRNANKCNDALDIWHVSLAADYAFNDELHMVANTGIEKNPDIKDNADLAFGLVGLYYHITSNCELSTAYKNGFTEPEINHSFIFGLTFRF